MSRALKAPALGFWGSGFSFGFRSEVALPPRPSPFLRMAVPVAAMLYSCFWIGSISVTPPFFDGR